MNQRSRMTRLKITRLTRMAMSHTSSTLVSNSTEWRDQPILKLPLTTRTAGNARMQATPVLIRRRRRSMQTSGSIEADGGRREYDGDGQHGREIDDVV